MPDKLTVALEAAKLGAKHALTYFNKDIAVELKVDNTPVTIADKETEQVIRKKILESFPDSKFVGEEGGGNLNEKDYWIIDPIDGTRMFLRGIPYWKVLIGYVKDGRPFLGISYSPFEAGISYAQIKEGSFHDGEKINVSKIDKLNKSVLCFGSLHHFKNRDGLIRLADQCGTTRSMDTAFSFLCQGKVDICVDSYGQPWDLIPYIPILEEAGGEITNLKGEKWTVKDVGCIMTNGLLHDEVIKIFNT